MACLSTSCFCHNPQPLLVQNSPELKLLGSGLRLGLPLCPTPGPAHGTWAVTCSVDKKGRLLPSRMLCLICVCLFVEAGVGGLFVFAWLMLWELSCYLALFRCLGWGYSARHSSLPPSVSCLDPRFPQAQPCPEQRLRLCSGLGFRERSRG